jgi:hypothetical protein
VGDGVGGAVFASVGAAVAAVVGAGGGVGVSDGVGLGEAFALLVALGGRLGTAVADPTPSQPAIGNADPSASSSTYTDGTQPSPTGPGTYTRKNAPSALLPVTSI